MRPWPTNAPTTMSRNQNDLDAASSRSSCASSQRSAPWLGEGKKDLLEATGLVVADGGRDPQLVDRTFTGDAASAQEDETVADALGVAELVDREEQRAPRVLVLAQQHHDVARL